MGRKGYETIGKIKQILDNGPKSGKQLKSEVSTLWGNNKPSDEKKSIESALIKLLENGDIEIVNYNSDYDKRNQKSKQVIICDPLIFDISRKMSSSDIVRLLNQLTNLETDEDTSRNARKGLKTIFIRKYRKYEKNNLKFYNSLLPRVNIIPAEKERDKQMEELEKEAQELYESNKGLYETYLGKVLKLGHEWRFVRDPQDKKRPHPDFIEYHKSLKKTYLYYGRINENSKVWEITNLTPDEAWTLTKYKYRYKENISISEIDEEKIKELWRKLGYSKGAWIDKDGTGTPESYLRTFGITDKKMSEDDKSEMFNLVLFFISTHENYKVLKHHLAFALSDERDSMSWFERFIDYIYTEPFTLKFQKDLGIPKPKNFF